MKDAITLDESKQLVELEETIAKGKESFVAVGLALAKIRERKLYKADYDTFEEYCRGKWGWEKRYVQYVVASAQVVKALPEATRTIVHSESQARELAKVPQGERAKVIKAALEAGPVTAKSIRQAASTQVEKPAVIAHTEAMPKTLDDKFRAAMGGTIPPVPKTDPRRVGLLCYQCCVERLIPNATIEELESLKSFWHSDMHTSCLGLVNERLSELKAEAKQAAKAKKGKK